MMRSTLALCDGLTQVVDRLNVGGPDLEVDRPFVVGVGLSLALLLLAGTAILIVRVRAGTPGSRLVDFERRYRSWTMLVPAILLPMAIGSGWMIISVALLSVLAYRDCSSAVGTSDLSLLVSSGPGIAARQHPWLSQPVLPPSFLVAINDIVAYRAGQAIGRHPLAPALSPNKTVEGALCGVLASGIVAVALGSMVFPDAASPALLASAGIALGVIGQAGDLVVSAVKPDLKLKDMGQGLPGMGGVLDRVDSLLLVAPLVCILAYLHRPDGSRRGRRRDAGGVRSMALPCPRRHATAASSA